MLIAGTPGIHVFLPHPDEDVRICISNPVLGRRNIPSQFRTGLTLVLTIVIYQAETAAGAGIGVPLNSVEFGLMLLIEFGIAMCWGSSCSSSIMS